MANVWVEYNTVKWVTNGPDLHNFWCRYMDCLTVVITQS